MPIAITSVKYEHNYVTMTFDKGIWRGGFGGITPAQTTDFTLTYTDNSDTGSSAATIYDITGVGNGSLGGDATTVRLWITTTGIPIGSRCTVRAASAKNDTLTINNPVISTPELNINLTTNTTDNLLVTKVDNMWTINIALANATASKNTATLIQTAIRSFRTVGLIPIDVSALTCTAGGNWDTAAIATGELTTLLMGGLATFEIKPTSGSSISDSTNIHYLPATATTGVYNLNPFKYIYATKNGLDTNNGLTARLPKLSIIGAASVQATGRNKLIIGIGDYSENGNVAASSGKTLSVLGDNNGAVFNSAAGTCRWTTTSNTNEAYMDLFYNVTRKMNWAGGVIFDAIRMVPTVFYNSPIELNVSTYLFYNGITQPVCFINSPCITTAGNPTLGWQYSGTENYLGPDVTLDNCDWSTNFGTGSYSGSGYFKLINGSKMKHANVYSASSINLITDSEWNTSMKHNYGLSMPNLNKVGNPIWKNITNVSTTQDFYNLFNSTAPVSYPTGTGFSINPTNEQMYKWQEATKLFIQNINSDSGKYLITPAGIYIKYNGTRNNSAQWDFYCSKVSTTGINRFWYKLNTNDTTNYQMTYDFKRYFTTATAKNILIEIVKGQSIAESTAITSVTKLATDYTDNVFQDNNTLNFTTLADNDDYWLSIKLPTAVGTNNIFSFVYRGIATI